MGTVLMLLGTTYGQRGMWPLVIQKGPLNLGTNGDLKKVALGKLYDLSLGAGRRGGTSLSAV